MNTRLDVPASFLMRNAKFSLLTCALFALATTASAQRGAGHVAIFSHPMRSASAHVMTRGSMAAHPIVIHLPAAPRIVRASNSANATPSAFSPANPQLNNSVPAFSNFLFNEGAFNNLGPFVNNVPGLGFDYSHLAALNQNFGEKAFTDPATQEELALSEGFQANQGGVFWGIPFYGGGYEEPVEYQQTPQVIYAEPAQEPAPESQAAESPAQPEAQPEAAPLPDIGEFILVLQDGTQIKTVAFTRQADRIVYITKDGVRKSFPASDLDSSATEQVNQQRGTPLQLP